eukprot:COSAG02_NODE_53_length_44062_cov_22.860223_22_plen_101_part_00
MWSLPISPAAAIIYESIHSGALNGTVGTPAGVQNLPESDPPPRGLTQIPTRPRVRDTLATESVSEFPMILIIPNLGPCTYLPSARTLYENPGHAEPQSRR